MSNKIIIKATKDKETKNMYRYNIDTNDKGVSGVIYLSKEEYNKPPKKIKIIMKES